MVLTFGDKIKKARSGKNRPLLTYEKHQVYNHFITAASTITFTFIIQSKYENVAVKIERVINVM